MWQQSMFVFRNNFLQHRPWEVMSGNRIRLEHKPQLSKEFKLEFDNFGVHRTYECVGENVGGFIKQV